MKIDIKTQNKTYTWQPKILINNIKEFILGTSFITIPLLGIMLSNYLIGKLGL
nr:MAG TPA: hypothetical protein [Caudoviricetes sp.]